MNNFDFNPSNNAAKAFRSVFTNDPMTIRSNEGFGSQFHMHTDNYGNNINDGHIKTNFGEYFKLNNYQSAMADYYADNLGMNKISRGTF